MLIIIGKKEILHRLPSNTFQVMRLFNNTFIASYWRQSVNAELNFAVKLNVYATVNFPEFIASEYILAT